MSSAARLAIGAVQSASDHHPMLWAVMDALDREGVRIQPYSSRACFCAVDAATSITGVTPRHLDSWLMSAEQCRRLFSRTARESDLAILDGRFDVPAGAAGGQLEPLCQWLGVPRLAVVDVAQLARCNLIARPERAAGLLLDRVVDGHDFARWQTVLESVWGIPVVGGLERLEPLREEIKQAPPGETAARDVFRSLGNHLLRYTSSARLLQIASQMDFQSSVPFTSGAEDCDFGELSGVQVAVAYDDVFHCYFQDALDALESRGAVVRDFSPLRDESLPPDTDLVFIGCGHPERYVRELGQNHCLMLALHEHVCAGKRVYGEGGGLAYLCQSIMTRDGEIAPMVGVLPAVAFCNGAMGPPEPVEMRLANETWFGSTGTAVRGYLNKTWTIRPAGRLTNLGDASQREWDLLARHQAVGSRLHLNLVTQPRLLERFLRPCPAALAWAGA
jgi:cobyrinic acid a,c-diamide synthase